MSDHTPAIWSDSSKQRHRLRRFLAAVASSSLVLVAMYVMVRLDMMTEGGFYRAVAGAVFCFITFATLFLTGLNKRAKDPSLTAGMMSCALSVLSIAMFYCSSSGRGLLLMVFLVSFIFGILRLQMRELLSSGLIASLMYAAVISMLLQYRPEAMDLSLELMRWLVMSCVLGWFSIIGGHINRVRKRLSDRNLELARAFDVIQELATHDALTGLHNRRYLEEVMRHEASQGERSNRPFCVCLLDIDFFKSINDTYGHEGGDQVLKAFAACILPIVRKSDHFGRFGGEEFLGILTNTDVNGALIWADNLRRRTEQLVVKGLPAEFRFTVSIGITQYCEGEDIERAVARADGALYCAKSDGRNRAVAN